MGGLSRIGSGSVDRRGGWPFGRVLTAGLGVSALVAVLHFGGELLEYADTPVATSGNYSVTAICPDDSRLVIDTSQNGDVITRGATEKLYYMFNHDEILLQCAGTSTGPVRSLTNAEITGSQPAGETISNGTNAFRLTMEYTYLTEPIMADWAEPRIEIDNNLGPLLFGDDGKNLQIRGGDLDMKIVDVDIEKIG